MATYLEENKTRVPQGVRVRRNGAAPSGVVVLHTAENATDFEGYDGGAESVASFIGRRTDYGCYHVLCDSDSRIQMAPWSWETWHDTGTNNHSVGISAAIACADWDDLDKDRAESIVKQMAAAAADYAKWLKRVHDITIPAKKITRAQSRAKVPGFLGHGDSDPGRRHDPGKAFDWDLFLAEYKRLMTGNLTPAGKPTIEPEPVQEDIDMQLFKWGRTRYRVLSGGAFRGIPASLGIKFVAAGHKAIELTDAEHTELVKNFTSTPDLVKQVD